jgi:RNA recognition motif-containing protein
MYFEQFGEVKHIDFKRGFAFVHFVSPESVEACCKTAGSEHFIDGRKVEVKISEPHLANKSANFHAHRPDYQQQQQQYPGGGMMGNVPGVGGDEDAANQAHIDDMQSAANLRDAPGLNVGRKVFVGGLNQDVREEDLRKMMEHHGAIEDAIVMIDKFTKRSRGFGFVTFLTREEAENASKQRRQILGGRQCEVKLYEPGAKGQFYHQRAAQMIGPPGAAQPMPYQHHNNNDWSRHRPFNNNFRGGRGGGPYGGPPQHQAPYYAQQVGYGGGGMDYMQQAQGGWGGAGGGYDYSQQQQQQGGWYPPRGGYGGRGGGYQGRGGFQGAPRPNFQQQQQPPPSQQ